MPSRPVRAPPRKRPRTRSILVVDDVEDNRALYAMFFEHVGFRVAQASDGNRALAIVAKDKPSAIIMDLSMPGLDGWEATRRLKSDPKTANIVVVVLTAHAIDDAARRAKTAGADAVVTKPCLPGDLHVQVEKLLDARRSRCRSASGRARAATG